MQVKQMMVQVQVQLEDGAVATVCTPMLLNNPVSLKDAEAVAASGAQVAVEGLRVQVTATETQQRHNDLARQHLVRMLRERQSQHPPEAKP